MTAIRILAGTRDFDGATTFYVEIRDSNGVHLVFTHVADVGLSQGWAPAPT